MRRFIVVALALALAACARSAPDLPPDYGSVSASQKLTDADFTQAELAKSCARIDGEQDDITKEASLMNGIIAGNRTRNQVAGYFGGLFLFPLAAARNNPGEKARLDALQARWDRLVMLERHKQCPTDTAGG